MYLLNKLSYTEAYFDQAWMQHSMCVAAVIRLLVRPFILPLSSFQGVACP